MATIRERKTSKGEVRYMAVVRLKGYPPQTATFNRKTDAKKWVSNTEAAIREGRHFKTTEAKKHTLASLIDRYIRDVLPAKPKSQLKQAAQLKWWREELGYRMQCDGEWQEMRQKVFFDSTQCHYGSERKWFKCPHCQRRCEILYFGRSGFYCRTCYRIPYGSQCEGKLDRMIRKRDKIKDRILDETGFRKRKGMHMRTFEPLWQEYVTLDEWIDDAIIARWGQWC